LIGFAVYAEKDGLERLEFGHYGRCCFLGCGDCVASRMRVSVFFTPTPPTPPTCVDYQADSFSFWHF